MANKNYLFLLGRNIELSKAEIFSYFEKQGKKVVFLDSVSNALVVELDSEIEIKEINKLGGTIAIGNIIFSGSLESILKQISGNPIYFGKKNKFSYTLLSFAEENSVNNVYSAMRENFRTEKLKAQYRMIRGTVKMQGGELAIGSPSRIERELAYFLFKKKEEYCFGVIGGVFDAKESERRDMGKPVRREELAISPRLAKILINLSGVKPGETLLDPFCGIGVILGEALLGGINVVGVDADGTAVEGARKNVDWLKKNYKIKGSGKINLGDSRNFSFGAVHGAATEPALGELLKKVPEKEKARKIIGDFERLIIGVLRNMKKSIKKGGRIAFTAPSIKARGGIVSCNITRICKEAGLRIYNIPGVNFPIREYRKEQVIGREIFLLVFS